MAAFNSQQANVSKEERGITDWTDQADWKTLRRRSVCGTWLAPEQGDFWGVPATGRSRDAQRKHSRSTKGHPPAMHPTRSARVQSGSLQAPKKFQNASPGPCGLRNPAFDHSAKHAGTYHAKSRGENMPRVQFDDDTAAPKKSKSWLGRAGGALGF